MKARRSKLFVRLLNNPTAKKQLHKLVREGEEGHIVVDDKVYKYSQAPIPRKGGVESELAGL